MANATRFQVCAIRATRLAQQTIKTVSRGRIRPLWTFTLVAHFAERNRLAEKHLGKDEKREKKATEPEPPSVYPYMTYTNRFSDPLSRYKRRARISSITCASVA